MAQSLRRIATSLALGSLLLVLLTTGHRHVNAQAATSDQLKGPVALPPTAGGQVLSKLLCSTRLDSTTNNSTTNLSEASKQVAARRKRDVSGSDCLIAVNHFRKLHRVPELKWDDKLANRAVKHSQRMASRNVFEPDVWDQDGMLVGFYPANDDKECTSIILKWYMDGQKLYNYTAPREVPGAEKFLEIVWRSKTSMGCGQASTNTGKGPVWTCIFAPGSDFKEINMASEVLRPKNNGDSTNLPDEKEGEDRRLGEEKSSTPKSGGCSIVVNSEGKTEMRCEDGSSSAPSTTVSPVPSSTTQGSGPEKVTSFVKDGDTCWTLAQKCKISFAAFKSKNSICSNDYIFPGDCYEC